MTDWPRYAGCFKWAARPTFFASGILLLRPLCNVSGTFVRWNTESPLSTGCRPLSPSSGARPEDVVGDGRVAAGLADQRRDLRAVVRGVVHDVTADLA